MKITRGYETFSAESIAEIHFVLEVSFNFKKTGGRNERVVSDFSGRSEKEDGDLRTWTHNGGGGKAAGAIRGECAGGGKEKECFCGFFGQFADLLVGIPIVAAAISACSGNPESTFVILVVIVLNALLGTIQYVKAEKSLEKV